MSDASATIGLNRTGTGYGDGPQISHSAPEWDVFCGPLLNYKGMRSDHTWTGTVLIVAKPNLQEPTLYYRCVGSVDTAGSAIKDDSQSSAGVKLYETPEVTFWRFSLVIPLQDFEAKWEYNIPGVRLHHESKTTEAGPTTFVVPARSQSMRIMFHSCNGFSVGTDEEAWSGPALWNDVLRVHAQKPFHVMLGGGDQIYNDGVRVNGPLAEWTAIANPKKRRDYPFPDTLRGECDDYYLKNYIRWYGTAPFSIANSQIPQINIWDDHDIIDGFGSYVDFFMRCAVFRGIGGVAHKYYSLFQHHIAPPKSTFTTDAEQTMHDQHGTGSGADPRQLEDTFVFVEKEEDPSFIIGSKPGPYVEEKSRSCYMRLGAHIAFIGIDARTERTRHQVNYSETYDLIFQRLQAEIQSAGPEVLKHLIVLLGIPIAYPRLVWLENILSSPLIGPIRFLNRRFGIAGGMFNKFDGAVDILDDLDDHYCARQHKKERNILILRLQTLAKAHNIRVTILGGDVHLCAIGRFYSNPKLKIETENDYRYITNVISSAITNKPPPHAVANLIARRNRIHHLDDDTDETLLKIFNKDPGNQVKKAKNNHVTMPSRNYATLTECAKSAGAKVATQEEHALETNGHVNTAAHPIGKSPSGTLKNGHMFLGKGEEGAGTTHPAADGVSSAGVPGSLDVCLKVEINQHDPQGHTEGYGFYIPPLEAA